MKAENPICVPENIKFTEDNSKIPYKQEQNYIHKTQPNSKAIRNTWEVM
jgi:hypothetical protein